MKTKEDARKVILTAKLGSLQNASKEYLEALENELIFWLGKVKRKRQAI